MYGPYLDIDISDFKNRIHMAEEDHVLFWSLVKILTGHMKMQIRFRMILKGTHLNVKSDFQCASKIMVRIINWRLEKHKCLKQPILKKF